MCESCNTFKELCNAFRVNDVDLCPTEYLFTNKNYQSVKINVVSDS